MCDLLREATARVGTVLPQQGLKWRYWVSGSRVAFDVDFEMLTNVQGDTVGDRLFVSSQSSFASSSEMIASLAALAGVVLGAEREEEGRPLLVFQPSGVGEESEEWRGS